MEIKYTIQGLLIYAAVAAYIFAFLTTLLRRPKVGHVLYVLGFAAAALAFGYRWYRVGHVPFQNLFEVFLSLGMMIYPVSLFCRHILRVGGFSADMLIGAIVLFPAGFVFSAGPQQLPPALQSWLFVPHVAVYMLSYIFMAKAACQAVCQLGGLHGDERLLPFEDAAYRMICAGFPLLTLGLILGSVWGKLAWGDYWNWDPKELWSLASWLVYVGYFHFSYMSGKTRPRISSVWAIVGFAVIVITLLWVNLSKLFIGLHTYAA
ncbi:MAG: cytochrome c biogenesis protein CcsA [Phycisphaerae bacterium]|jgi:ABC-type transport system involved in cytochrome c biogenesis permease subunit